MAMKRTLEGFLKAYCAELTGLETTSLRRLVAAAGSEAPRVTEPLFLLALEERELDYLLRIAEGTRMESEWEPLARTARAFDGDTQSWIESGEAPERYRRVLSAFEAQGDLLRAKRRMNAIMRERTLAALAQSGMTRYRLAGEAGANRGNLYAWLAGDDSKVGEETARRVMEVAEAATGKRVTEGD